MVGEKCFFEPFFTHIFQACVGGLPSKPMWRDHESFGLFSALTSTASMMASHKGIPLTWQTRLFSFNENLLESKHLCVSVKQRGDSPFVCGCPLPWFCRSQLHWCLFFPHKKRILKRRKKNRQPFTVVLFFFLSFSCWIFFLSEGRKTSWKRTHKKQTTFFVCLLFFFFGFFSSLPAYVWDWKKKAQERIREKNGLKERRRRCFFYLGISPGETWLCDPLLYLPGWSCQ